VKSLALAATLLSERCVRLAIKHTHWKQRWQAFTLMEVLISMVILGIMITGIVSGFIQSQKTAEWSAYSLAAQWYAMQPLEQARAARWDPAAAKPLDELTNIAPLGTTVVTTNVLDIPVSGTNIVCALIAREFAKFLIPTAERDLGRVHMGIYESRVFTNAVLTYRAPGQADQQ